ncbi:uncharacterized protein TNCT_104321 [Trichonephila clavata]|uniref:Uncharacterized protein n=1 Tax=Trichonephila clavata TaxID=2740835 RepID=A0A8X6M3I2_TRICU|nr:uncharacterized protein TNCT_104321 [Trichonephila clavata]
MFDILAHHVPQCLSKRKIKKVNKLPTTYRTDYCRKKIMQPPANIIPPYPGIFIPNQKMSTDTTHKNDFKPFNEKEGKGCRGEIVHQKGHLTCPKVKFESKSETKAVFKYPVSKKAFGPHDFSTVLFKKCPGSGRKTTSEASMQTSTTYSMSYKKPKNIQKPVAWKPKLHIIPKSDMPFKYTSQYQDDYKKPKQPKKESSKKTPSYRPPEVPMEDHTTYKSAYYYKVPVEKKRTKWNPDNKIYKTAIGGCDCSCIECLNEKQCRTKSKEQLFENICCCQKENNASLLVKANKQ